MTLRDDQIALAAEYVLGTLDLVEREEAERLIAGNSEFAEMVKAWQNRLGELQALVASVEPPATTWEAIKIRIASLRAGETDAGLPARDANVVVLKQRVRAWRAASAGLGALAAALAVLFTVQAFRPDLLPWPSRGAGGSGQFVAVLQRDATAPAFIMSVDVDKRTFTVRRVSAQDEPGKSYELWLVSDRFDKPRSLGVIGERPLTVSARLADYDPQIINQATYAVSIEPEGGSPTGVATGPVVYTGKLVDVLPDGR